MKLNIFTIVLIIIGYITISQTNPGLNPYMGWSILSAIMLSLMLFTYLIKETENIIKNRSNTEAYNE